MQFYSDTFLPLDGSFNFSVLDFVAAGKKWEVVCTLRQGFFLELKDSPDMSLDQMIDYIDIKKATAKDGTSVDAYQWLDIIRTYKLHAGFSFALVGMVAQIFSALYFFDSDQDYHH